MATKKAKAPAQDIRPVSAGYIDADIRRLNGSFVLCAAQNNTDIHAHHWQLIRDFARYHGADILVAPILYNKAAFAQPDDVSDMHVRFDAAVRPFMVEDRVIINDNVLFVGNAHVLPTAKNPLSGFASVSTECPNIIIPASKIALESQPALKGQVGRLLMSTGTTTQCNYIQRKAGVTAESEHNFGFVFCQPGKLPRIVEYVNGGFFDFDGKKVTEWGNLPWSHSRALILGDIHAEKCPEYRVNAVCNIIEALAPSDIVLHDLLDFTSRNHHNRGNPFFRAVQDAKGESVYGDIEKAVKFCNAVYDVSPDININVIDSNHDRALDRWIDDSDWRADPHNGEAYLTLALAKLRASKAGEHYNPFAHAFFVRGGSFATRFCRPDESLMLHGVECGMHGDRGPNGARGSLQAFRKLGVPLVVGHSHSPGIAGKAYQVGVTGSLEMGYNVGPSSWRHAHCIVWPNGQRQLLIEA